MFVPSVVLGDDAAKADGSSLRCDRDGPSMALVHLGPFTRREETVLLLT